MNKDSLKKELHILIDNTDDEELLNMVKEEIVAYRTNDKEFDDLIDLSARDRAELEEQDVEDAMKDTISHTEFKQNIAEWRSELLKRGDL